ncbi:MAG: hypothetical protein QXO69_02900 [archaeon]
MSFDDIHKKVYQIERALERMKTDTKISPQNKTFIENFYNHCVASRLSHGRVLSHLELIKKMAIFLGKDFDQATADDIEKFNFWHFNTLVDLKPENGLYIHSLSEPFNEEMEMSHDRMMNWLNHFKMNYFQSHCSGHINGPDEGDWRQKKEKEEVSKIQ